MGTYQKKGSASGLRVLVTFEDLSVHLFKDGELAWSREEALSNTLHASLVDIPIESIFLKADLETDEQYLLQRSVVENYIHRLIKHIGLLADLPALLSDTTQGDQLKGDIQGIHKMIVILTKGGKLFGLDSADGHVVWSVFIPEIVSGLTIPVRGATSHPAISLLIGTLEHVLPFFLPFFPPFFFFGTF